MLEIINKTPLEAAIVPGLDKDGYDYATIVLKGTYQKYNNKQELQLSENQNPIVYSCEYFGEPGASSIQYDADTAFIKSATDVVINGFAWAPGDKPVSTVDVSLQINDFLRTRRIFGNRYWTKNIVSWGHTAPEKFNQLPLIYENSYGGVDVQSDAKVPATFHEGNPLGKGFIRKKSGKPTEGLALPNIENPQQLISSWKDSPNPVGFGYTASHWQPRVVFAGSYDEQWLENRSPLLPDDFNVMHFNAAHADFITKGFLQGGELVSISNVTESGHFDFKLPGCSNTVTVSIKGQKTDYQTLLDTVVIEPSNQTVLVTWRVTVPCFKQFLYIDTVTISSILEANTNDK